MFCENCGKNLEEGAQFCDACGTPIAAPAQVVEEPAQAPVPPVYEAPAATQVVNNYYQESRQPVSVAGWIFRPLIAAIPLVGPIIYFIMLFVWANNKSMEVSFNNWAKAQLWLMLIAVALVVVIGIIVLVIINSTGMMGSGYYY